MAYAQSGGLLEFFQPVGSGVLAFVDVGEASAAHGEYVCVKPCSMKRLLFEITSEAVVATTTAPTVVFKKRPTPLSASGESTVGILTIPNGTAPGKVLYKEVQVDFQVGDALQISWTVGVGGTPAGQGIASAEAFYDDENPANMSDMILSA